LYYCGIRYSKHIKHIFFFYILLYSFDTSYLMYVFVFFFNQTVPPRESRWNNINFRIKFHLNLSVPHTIDEGRTKYRIDWSVSHCTCAKRTGDSRQSSIMNRDRRNNIEYTHCCCLYIYRYRQFHSSDRRNDVYEHLFYLLIFVYSKYTRLIERKNRI